MLNPQKPHLEASQPRRSAHKPRCDGAGSVYDPDLDNSMVSVIQRVGINMAWSLHALVEWVTPSLGEKQKFHFS